MKSKPLFLFFILAMIAALVFARPTTARTRLSGDIAKGVVAVKPPVKGLTIKPPEMATKLQGYHPPGGGGGGGYHPPGGGGGGHRPAQAN